MTTKANSHYVEDVYEVVRSIPKGRISTYGAIADFLALGSARMVGWALRQSSVMDGPIPAHRVVNRLGHLSGRLHFPDPKYMQRALEKEGVKVKNDTVVDFDKHFWHPAENIL
ncbi:MAG: MGMT family protein [Saprospiraceae bacterium]|uniref:MGMT family protein n=1 Tax=Candidatus Opimibacter skivensis TaxID=2982028 RepID=A0A9D7SZA4_9BACT|nr:MGMT family protein [Candidatus Opimibacter skivensis]